MVTKWNNSPSYWEFGEFPIFEISTTSHNIIKPKLMRNKAIELILLGVENHAINF